MSKQTDLVYERAGFGRPSGWGMVPAVLVVDLSLGFTDPACPLGSDLSAVIENLQRVLDIARNTERLVVFTSIAYQDPARDGGAWVRKVPTLGNLTVGSKWIELDPRLQRRPSEPVIYKRGASAFFGTHLNSLLVAGRVDTILVAGATTSGCVRASVVDAVQSGFHTLVIRECVGDRAPGPPEANMFDMAAKYADLVTVTEVEDYLQSLAQQPGSLP